MTWAASRTRRPARRGTRLPESPAAVTLGGAVSVLERRRLRPRRGVRVLPRPREDAARGRRGRGRGRGHAINLAHCAALLDEAEAARLAIERANDALDEAEALAAHEDGGEPGAGGDGGERRDARFERGRQGCDARGRAREDSSATATYKGRPARSFAWSSSAWAGSETRQEGRAVEKPDVAEYLTRALVFENRRVEGPSGGGRHRTDGRRGDGRGHAGHRAARTPVRRVRAGTRVRGEREGHRAGARASARRARRPTAAWTSPRSSRATRFGAARASRCPRAGPFSQDREEG